jgi:hypothetical protein
MISDPPLILVMLLDGFGNATIGTTDMWCVLDNPRPTLLPRCSSSKFNDF